MVHLTEHFTGHLMGHLCASATECVPMVGTLVVAVSASVEICGTKPPQYGLPWRLRTSSLKWESPGNKMKPGRERMRLNTTVALVEGWH